MLSSAMSEADWSWIAEREDGGLWPLWRAGEDGTEIVEFWSSWLNAGPDLTLEFTPPDRFRIRSRDGKIAGGGRSAADAFMRYHSIVLIESR